MTGKQIIEKLSSLGITPENLRYVKSLAIPATNLKYVEGVGAYKQVEVEGDFDWSGPIYEILHFVDHDVYIKVTGHYTSHVGEEWNGWLPVQPKEVVVKSWEEVQ